MALTRSRSLRLSDRVTALKPSATLAVTARVKALRDTGIDIVGFGVGEPDFDTPEHIRRAAVQALDAGLTHYMPVPGDPAARKAIARKLQDENKIRCTADDIIISAGAKHSIYLALQSLLDPGRGQQVLLLTPAWVSYRPMVELAGGEVIEVPGDVHNDFKITPQQLADALTAKTAVIILNSPSNPCGTMYSPQELRALADVLTEHDQVVIIADEIYEKLIFGGIDHLSLGSIEAIADRVITINGLSKSYAMTGWRIGYACAPGDGGAVAKAMARLQSQMTSCITSFCYAAIPQALEHGAADLERMRRAFGDRAELLSGLIDRWPDVVCPRPTGAFYVFPQIGAHFGKTSPAGRRIDSALSLAEVLLEEACVAVVPGEDFGESARRHIRLSFAVSESQIKEGCRRIEVLLKSLRG